MSDKDINRVIALVVMVMIILAPVWAQSQNNSESSSAQNFSKEELAQMLAPIALYPDALLPQMLIAASYPFEVVEADRWLARNPGLADEALDNALSQKDWDVSILSLCHYPKVLTMMSENINWTAKLGDAFVNQQQDVMDTVQELRARASAQGTLTNTEEQRVIVEERIIRIEPAYYNYMYVPVYDPLVIFGPWWLPAFLPFPIFYPGVVVTGPRVVFAPRLFVGLGVIGWSAFDWHAHNVVIVNIDRTKRFNRHVNVYRGPDHSPWRPDRERRFVRKQRAKEIPRFHPTAKSPREVPPGGFKRGPDVVVPPRSKPGPTGPRVIDRDRLPDSTSRVKDKGTTPYIGGPRVIDKDKRPDIGGPRVIDKDKRPPSDGPRIIDKGNPQQPQPRIIDRNKPIVRDRGSVDTVKPPKNQPRIENKGVTRKAKDADRGEPNNQLDVPLGGSEGNDVQRGNGDGRGGGNRGQRR